MLGSRSCGPCVQWYGGGRNTLWLHADDVAWLVTYLAEEVATGGVGPIDDADGEVHDEEADEAPFGDGAAVAVPSGGDPVTPIKAKRGWSQAALDF